MQTNRQARRDLSEVSYRMCSHTSVGRTSDAAAGARCLDSIFTGDEGKF